MRDVLGLGVLALEEVDVVRRDEGQSELPGQGDDLRIDGQLTLEPVVLELEVEIARGEKRRVFPGGLFRTLVLVPGQEEVDLALEAGREGDEALGPAGQDLLVDAGAVVESFQVAFGQELAEVPVALLVLDEQDEVEMMGLLVRRPSLVEPAPGGDIGLAAEDGLDAPGPGLLEEGDGPEDVAVVGDGHRRHPVLKRRLGQVGDLETAVQDAVLGVVVEMDIGELHVIPTRSSPAACS